MGYFSSLYRLSPEKVPEKGLKSVVFPKTSVFIKKKWKSLFLDGWGFGVYRKVVFDRLPQYMGTTQI